MASNMQILHITPHYERGREYAVYDMVFWNVCVCVWLPLLNGGTGC